jgi:LPXTG-motif cell wall-anchored protein
MRRGRFVGAVVLFAAAASAGFLPTPAGAANGKSITATPSTGLVDGQTVRIEGTGWQPYELLEIFECAGDSIDEMRCDPRNGFQFDADGSGHVRFDFPVDARIYLGPEGTTEYDCRTEPAGCRIGVGLMLEHANSAFATLTFDPAAPLLPVVTATVDPATGLVDGQTVSVHAANLTDFEAGWIFQCRTGDGPRVCDHDRAVNLKPEPDGTLATELTVHAAFRAPLGDAADCLVAPGACSVVVSWGFAWVPDRIAEVPLTFAPVPTTTVPPATSPVTAAATTTTAVATLPRTGSSPELPMLAAGLVVLGAVGVWFGRRARRVA